MMKKKISVCMAVMLTVFSLAGCGSVESEAGKGTETRIEEELTTEKETTKKVVQTTERRTTTEAQTTTEEPTTTEPPTTTPPPTTTQPPTTTPPPTTTQPPTTPEPTTPVPTVTEGFNTEYAERVLVLVNQVRAEVGAAPLTMNYTLVNASNVRAQETFVSFSHTRPDGRDCFTAFQEAGVGYYWAGENIAAGQRTPEQVVDAWANSPGHYANMVNTNFTEIAISCYYTSQGMYGWYWVQLFIG